MKLQILATICLLSTLAVASPRRYRAGPKQEQDAMKIESLEDVQNFAAQFYNKHGDQYQKAAQSVAAKLERAFQAGSTNEQRQKNIENVLIYNADQFIHDPVVPFVPIVPVEESEHQNSSRQHQLFSSQSTDV